MVAGPDQALHHGQFGDDRIHAAAVCRKGLQQSVALLEKQV
jgi:hypothetical protein